MISCDNASNISVIEGIKRIISGAPSTAAARDSVGHLLHHQSTLVCGGDKNGGVGLVLRFSDSVRRKAPYPRSCQPVMCALPRYAVRLYIPPVVESHTLRRHELLFRSRYRRQGSGPDEAEASHKTHHPVLMLLSVWLRDNSLWVLGRVCSHGFKLQQRLSSGSLGSNLVMLSDTRILCL
ncbi:hypothetical protein HID58_029486 [Brassica napus]|uniref:Uncharacterized protein n=1 Tax=Brassica napus TaxID=3708 RepID=A0ABQ8CFB0_BRANA|nr:hypothetical protein HID58_029486 [Brassica napus]